MTDRSPLDHSHHRTASNPHHRTALNHHHRNRQQPYDPWQPPPPPPPPTETMTRAPNRHHPSPPTYK